MTGDDQKLDVVLEICGISPLPQDKEIMLKNFVTAREQAALLWGVAEARYEEPGLIFSAKL
ncbi:MAG: hypothetical protein QOI36_2256 [Pseudonocardiales bacterium]|jgi:hypothetical protein|nr:hypothetical protein [Pseudonocardia sp.]MDT7650850.1 hypothetical protein [Pseudonocardiales bacterium]